MLLRFIPLALLLPLSVLAQTGSWVTQVTDLYPSVSPDGRLLTFHSSRLGRSDIFTASLDGRDLKHLGGDGTRITPVWSPDGREIAFVARSSGSLDVFVMSADGSNVRQLTNDPATDIHPHWSPDGRRIFFNSDRPVPGGPSSARRVHNIFSMDTDGGNVRRHSNCSLDCTYPVPSPSGKLLVFRREFPREGFDWDLRTSSEDSEIVVTNLDGGDERNLSNSAAFDGWPMWSPDGKWIAFASNRAGPALVGQIFLIRPDGTGLRQVTTGPWSHAQPTFSPDGRTLFFYRLQEGNDFQFGFIGQTAMPSLPQGAPE